MRRFLFLTFAMLLSMDLLAQLEVKEESFKEVPGFVNINVDKMYDENEKPYAVIKIRTENINNKQRRELVFEGNAATFFELEYKVGEIWVYISYYATFIKISHPDLSSTEFWFPFDMEPKKGYELTLINKPQVDEEILNRIERLEGAYSNTDKQTVEQDNTPKKVLTGVFSVSEIKKVRFSQGNLQYQASTDKWRFADNQWDYIGESNNRISNRYPGWIDLFGWGTGNDPTNNSKLDYSKFMDWGNNEILNGGNEIWWTLGDNEWKYLFEKRVTNTGIRYAKAIVNDISGVILFPDNWNISIYELKDTNKKDVDYTSNTINISDWENVLEINGAVFLPAAGYRNVNEVKYDGCRGYYWSDKHNGIYAKCICFDSGKIKYSSNFYISEGLSVRLVCEVE